MEIRSHEGEREKMRLSKGESLFLVCIILCSSLFILLPMGHSEELEHKLTVGKETTSAAEPTWNLYQLAVNEGIIPTAWTIYWRGSIPSQDQASFITWLEEDLFIKQERVTSSTIHDMDITEQVWKKEVNGTLHQVQVFNYPQKSKKMTNFIYTWSGAEMDQHWLDTYEESEQQLLNQLKLQPQNFSCIEGITNDKLKTDFLNHTMLDDWIAEGLDGQIIKKVSDKNFMSVNGYIPTWGEQFLSAGDQKFNVQISARYNALEQQTRVTIGYPLILKEH
jgi:hypothetical protein